MRTEKPRKGRGWIHAEEERLRKIKKALLHHGARWLIIMAISILLPNVLPERIGSLVVSAIAVYSDRIIAFISSL